MNKTSAALWTEAKRLQGIELSLIRQVMAYAPKSAINMALGELAFPMPQSLKDKAIEYLQKGNPAYTPNAGMPELRESIAERYNSSSEQVIVCNGAEEALFLALMTIANPGDKIAIPNPDYPAYPAIARIFGAEVVRLPFLDTFSEIDWDRWEEILSQDTKILLLSAPSNPSGFFFDTLKAARLAEICNRHGIIVIVDEIYSTLYFESEPTSLIEYVENLIQINGLSKSHTLSGWRLGWIVAPLPITPSLTKARQYVSTCSHWLSQKLAIYAFSDEGMKVAENIRQQLAANHKYTLQRLKNPLPESVSALHAPKATPYIMIQVADDMQYAKDLATKGVICVPGRAFGSSSINWVRLNIGLEPEQLSQGLDTICGSKTD